MTKQYEKISGAPSPGEVVYLSCPKNGGHVDILDKDTGSSFRTAPDEYIPVVVIGQLRNNSNFYALGMADHPKLDRLLAYRKDSIPKMCRDVEAAAAITENLPEETVCFSCISNYIYRIAFESGIDQTNYWE